MTYVEGLAVRYTVSIRELITMKEEVDKLKVSQTSLEEVTNLKAHRRRESIFIKIPRKAGTMENEKCRTISTVSCPPGKIIFSVIKYMMKQKIGSCVAEKQ